MDRFGLAAAPGQIACESSVVKLTGPALSAPGQSESNTIPNNQPLQLLGSPHQCIGSKRRSISTLPPSVFGPS